MGLADELKNHGGVYEGDVNEMLQSSPEPDVEFLYTGTTAECMSSKVQGVENGNISNPDGDYLWFTPNLHDDAFSAIYYAGQALQEANERGVEETPVLLEWEVPVDQIYSEGDAARAPDGQYLVESGDGQQYWAEEVPLENLNGFAVPDEGRRMKDDWEIDPQGWAFMNYDSSVESEVPELTLK